MFHHEWRSGSVRLEPWRAISQSPGLARDPTQYILTGAKADADTALTYKHQTA